MGFDGFKEGLRGLIRIFFYDFNVLIKPFKRLLKALQSLIVILDSVQHSLDTSASARSVALQGSEDVRFEVSGAI